MRSRKGFTLIELMVVVLIVAVLAAVLIPMLQARIEAAKWSEGKAGAGTIATAIRSYVAENGDQIADYSVLNGTGVVSDATNTGPNRLFKAQDLYGKYFRITHYTIAGCTYAPATGAITYTISVAAPDTGWKVQTVTLNHLGTWTP